MQKKTKKKKVKRTQKRANALPKKERLNGRLFFVGMIMCGALIGLGGVVTYLTIFKHEEYTAGALANMNQSERVVEARRGTIQDCNGRQLAVSLLTYNIILSPYEIQENIKSEETKELMYQQLEEATGVTASEIKAEVQRKLANNPGSKYYELAKKIDLSEEQVKNLNQYGGAVTVQETYKRNYPNGELAAQVLGFFNKNDEGQYGIEQGYDDYLVGQAGRAYSQFQGSNIVTREYQEPKAGSTVKLTIDQIVQEYVEDTMKKYIDQYNPSSASCIIMEPNTGEILAMYSYPSYNPNTFTDLSAQLGESVWVNKTQEEKSTALYKAWKNNGIQLNYEPGSTFKPLFVALALQEGLISTADTYYCEGSKKVADRTIKCWDTDGHGYQTLDQALANSCNVAMMDIAEKVDSDMFLSYLSDYGFGEKTGIELAGEENGYLFKSSMGSVDKATASLGQNFKVTPIQLITAFSTLINGGYLMEPYVVSEVISDNGSILLDHGRVTRRQVISSSTAELVKNALQKVVDEGTGSYASIPGYTIGGKTGTGQKFKDGTNERIEGLYAVSFMGFAPVDNPKVVGLIVFDDLPEGTGAPASAFKDMMVEIFPYLDIPTSGDAVIEGERVETIPDVTGMDIYEATNTLTNKGLEYNIVGNGITVTSQYPQAGTEWGGTVTLYTSTDEPGELIEVPDLSGKTIEEAKEIVGEDFVIIGSGSGIIQLQLPKAGYKIEKNNKIIIRTSE